MAYKEKTCQKCGVTHKKRGPYCSRSCGNQKKHTEESKKAISDAKREWHATSDVAAVVAHNYISKRNNGDPDPVPPISPTPVRSNQFVQDGDLWEEC